MPRDSFGNTAQEKPSQSLAPVGTHNHQIGRPFARCFDDDGFCDAFFDGGGYPETGITQSFSGLCYECLRFFALVLKNRLPVYGICPAFDGRKRFDHMHYLNLRVLRASLDYLPDGCF